MAELIPLDNTHCTLLHPQIIVPHSQDTSEVEVSFKLFVYGYK